MRQQIEKMILAALIGLAVFFVLNSLVACAPYRSSIGEYSAQAKPLERPAFKPGDRVSTGQAIVLLVNQVNALSKQVQDLTGLVESIRQDRDASRIELTRYNQCWTDCDRRFPMGGQEECGENKKAPGYKACEARQEAWFKESRACYRACDKVRPASLGPQEC